jgi:hypothetical protein
MAPSDSDRLKGSIKGDAERRERLASELRANLKKRKAQARLREAASPIPSDDPSKRDRSD